MFNAKKSYKFIALTLIFASFSAASFGASIMTKIYEIPVKTIQGKETNLSEFKGKVLLLVNTASECGYTPQYEGLENLYKKYREKGFYVLGFPSNDFGGQEPGTDAEIKKFCELKYKTTFPMFSKVAVKGDKAHPLYAFLQKEGAAEVKWNFGKFLVGKDGKIAKYFASGVTPDSKELAEAVEAALAK